MNYFHFDTNHIGHPMLKRLLERENFAYSDSLQCCELVSLALNNDAKSLNKCVRIGVL